MVSKLTAKQERFVAEYLVDLNATQAAARAGYKDPNIGRQLITKNDVSAAIQKAIKLRSDRTEITQDMVLRELARIAFANGTAYAKVVDVGGAATVRLTPTDRLTDDQKAAVVSIKETQTGIEIKIGDKIKALDLLGRHLGMFTGREGQDIEDVESAQREVFDGDKDENP